MLSTPEECKARALQDCDPRYTGFLLDCAAYSLTGEWQKDKGANRIDTDDSDWPWQVDIWPDRFQVEKSRRLTDSNTMRRSRHLSGQVQPKFGSEIDKHTAQARVAWWNKRYKEGYWGHAVGGMFDDFDLLGVGSDGIGLESDREYKQFQKTSVRHFKATDVLWERNCRHPSLSRRVTRRYFVSLEEALFVFHGSRASASQIRNAATETRDNPTGSIARVVPVIEYWDVGLAGSTGEGEKARGVMKDPTRCVWLGSLSNGVCAVHEANPFGCLPHSFMVGKLPPECRWPIGSVVLEMAANELASQMAAFLIAHLKKASLDIWNKSNLDPRQLAAYKKGLGDGNIDMIDGSLVDVKLMLHRESGASITNALPMLADMVDRRYNQAAGLSEADQGTFIDQDKTLGEFEQTQGEAKSNRAFGKEQVQVGLCDLMGKVFKVGAKFDRCPVQVAVEGDDYWVNDPNDPRSWADQMFAEPAEVTVDSAALTATDARLDSMRKMQDLASLLPLAEAGLISMQKLAEETLKAKGETPSEWHPTEQELMAKAAQATLAQNPAA